MEKGSTVDMIVTRYNVAYHDCATHLVFFIPSRCFKLVLLNVVSLRLLTGRSFEHASKLCRRIFLFFHDCLQKL